ncbi:MAG TPA: ferredoxin reductase [Solirubrobacteraceae bacterium]|nr:ferredoxin reductase [Solirubrobacteraceae bacterium]
MAGAALPGRLTWQLARVVEVTPETAQTKTLVLDAPDWAGHRAGQHVDVRLTAEDGYQAQRSYSIASAPEDDHLMLTVEEIPDGEVSPYLAEELRAGDELELRGPIGGWFVWEGSEGAPLLMFGGGSGVVPLRAMLRHRAATSDSTPARLVYSARSLQDVIYREELERSADGVEVCLALTRSWPEDWTGHRGRVNDALLDDIAWPASDTPAIYICGPNGFVEAISRRMVARGHDPVRVKTERFGPSS